jgi:hypothetical protein
VQAEEARLCPEAGIWLFDNPAPVGKELAWLAAEALRRQAGTDIAFCHPGHILRDNLPVGPVNVNAVFLTGGQRGHAIVRTTLRGAEILAYVDALAAAGDPSAWSGFTAGAGSPDQAGTLDPERNYSVVMPEMEWTKRFLRAATRAKGRPPLGNRTFQAEPAPVHYLESLIALITALPVEQRDIARLIATCRKQAGGE